MKIEVGDRVTYKRNDDGITRKACITTQANNLLLNTDEYEILKIERPNWEVVEEKEELLTEEEREFLQGFIDTWKIMNVKIKSIWKFVCNNGLNEYISFVFDDEHIEDMNLPQFRRFNNFKGMTANKQYTLSELGLEE